MITPVHGNSSIRNGVCWLDQYTLKYMVEVGVGECATYTCIYYT